MYEMEEDEDGNEKRTQNKRRKVRGALMPQAEEIFG